MIDKPIYFHTYDDPSRNRPYIWGDRRYFYNCNQEGGNYNWLDNNLPIEPETVTPEWTFDGEWNPEKTEGPRLIDYQVHYTRFVDVSIEKR